MFIRQLTRSYSLDKVNSTLSTALVKRNKHSKSSFCKYSLLRVRNVMISDHLKRGSLPQIMEIVRGISVLKICVNLYLYVQYVALIGYLSKVRIRYFRWCCVSLVTQRPLSLLLSMTFQLSLSIQGFWWPK